MVTGFSEKLLRDTKDANLAIFIENLACWIKYNASKTDPAERNYHEGRYWSYNTIQDFVKYFGFWSTKNIRTIIKHCVDHELVVTNTFNKKKYDNTIWYTLTDKALEYYPILRDIFLNRLAGCGKTLAGNGNTIPEELNSLGSNINITTSVLENADSSSNVLVRPDYLSETEKVELHSPEGLGPSAYTTKSDYHNNQT